MRQLALSDDILLQIEKPARYLGNEINSVKPCTDDNAVNVVMCFPDLYEIGMSHLGIQILYDMFNKMDGVFCDRVFSPWYDLDKVMREKGILLFALESQQRIKDFDILGITLQYELCYTNILQILELSGIPIYSNERTDDFPIVIGGGPCAYNAEPIADFFDIFYIGEGEVSYYDFISLYKEKKKNSVPRAEFLRQVADIPGFYVPSLYKVSYNQDFTIQSIKPVSDGVPEKVRKVVVKDFSSASGIFPEKPIIPYIKSTQDRAVLEIMRGCIRGCRFCQAGMTYRPARMRSLEELKRMADCILSQTGYDEISLSSLSSSDYSSLKDLIEWLHEKYKEKHVNINLPSLRIDDFSLEVMSKIQDIKKVSLTFAPEAGSEKLRNIINKNITEDDILKGSEKAFLGGWKKVKLYFMMGLPGETRADRTEIAYLADKIADKYYSIDKDKRNGRVSVTISTSFFIPKPFTPFQWAKMYGSKDFLDFAGTLNSTIKELPHRKSILYKWHEAKSSVIEGVLARGDRRLSSVIKRAYSNGCLFDSWSDRFSFEKWDGAFSFCKIDKNFYLKERREDELFPWDVIDAGISKNFLLSEWKKAKDGIKTENCRKKCSGCMTKDLKCGVCFESGNQT